MLFRFKVESREKTVKKIVLSFEGYGTAPGGNGVTVKVWNHERWRLAERADRRSRRNRRDNHRHAGVRTCQITLTTTGTCGFLPERSTPATAQPQQRCIVITLSCTVTVNGITYCDVAGFRDVDRVDVKPFIFRTEFTVKSWFFENIGV